MTDASERLFTTAYLERPYSNQNIFYLGAGESTLLKKLLSAI